VQREATTRTTLRFTLLLHIRRDDIHRFESSASCVSCSCILRIFYRGSRTLIGKDVHGHNAHPRAIRLEHKNTSKAGMPQAFAVNSNRVRSCDDIGWNLTSVLLTLQQETSRRLSGEHVTARIRLALRPFVPLTRYGCSPLSLTGRTA
jgi:hypothetical protein